MIIFEASALRKCGAQGVPERALLRAEEVDVFAPSAAVDGEIAGVLNRPRFARAIPLARRERVLEILRHAAFWFEPTVRVTDCRDPKDNKYLQLALAAGAETIVSSDDDLLVLDPGAACASWVRRTSSPRPDPVVKFIHAGSVRFRQYSQDVLQRVIEPQFIELDIFFEALE